MFVCSDSLEYAEKLLSPQLAGQLRPVAALGPALEPVVRSTLSPDAALYGNTSPSQGWTHLLLTERAEDSQCDRLMALARGGHDIPDRTVCAAGSGRRFHGFKGRGWSAEPGNLHLAVHFAPHCEIERFEVAFTILAAVSVVEAIDEVPDLRGRAGIRWVNDIVANDAKLGGVLAYTQTRHRTVTSAILGIGLNVEVTPAVGMTPFVPAVGSLRDLAADGDGITQRLMLERLLGVLQRNYDLLLRAGYRPLLERYRQRSTVIGRECMICTDESDMDLDVIATGRLLAIGDGLELHLAGESKPVLRGRLLVRHEAAMSTSRLQPGAHRVGR